MKTSILKLCIWMIMADLVVSSDSSCQDINTDSCRTMMQSNPQMCTDTTLATSVCPKLCGNCPLTCFSCSNIPSVDVTSCNRITCTQNQKCMIRSTHPTGPFTLGCEDQTTCTSSSTTTCCDNDLCNVPVLPTQPPTTQPPPTTTTVKTVPNFSNAIPLGRLPVPLVKASGCAASRKHPGFLYTHNDNEVGGHPEIIVIHENTTTPNISSTFTIGGSVQQEDWEDIAVGPCERGDNRSCIYILDAGSGDNNVYRIEEPDTFPAAEIVENDILKYDWTEHHADTIMVDNDANVFIIATNEGGHSKMAMLPEAAWNINARVWINADQYYYMMFPHQKKNPLGGDISPDGTEVLIKTYHNIFYYKVGPNDDLLTLLTQNGTALPYKQEFYGEAVCWSLDTSAYYTLATGEDPMLYKYERLS